MILEDILCGNGSQFKNIDFTEEIKIISASSTFIAPSDGEYYVLLSSGGGSGARSPNVASGGNSGNVKTAIVSLTSGQSVSVAIGAGGASPAGFPSDGNDGGASNFGAFLSVSGNGVGGKYSTTVTPANYYGYRQSKRVNYNGGSEFEFGDLSFAKTGLQGSYPYPDTSFSHGGWNSNGASGGAPSFLSNGGNAVANGSLGSGGGASYHSAYASGQGGDGFCVVIKVED